VPPEGPSWQDVGANQPLAAGGVPRLAHATGQVEHAPDAGVAQNVAQPDRVAQVPGPIVRVFRRRQVEAQHPKAAASQQRHEVPPAEAPGAGDQDRVVHGAPPSTDRRKYVPPGVTRIVCHPPARYSRNAGSLSLCTDRRIHR
jgi:hypothetical protein